MTGPGTLGEPDESPPSDASPSAAYPHAALLLGGSLLAVCFTCVLPLEVLEQVRGGGTTAVFLAITAIAIAVGLGPFASEQLQNPRYLVFALLVADALPLIVVASVKEITQARHWATLAVIPVLLAAATVNLRTYRIQLVAGCLVGVTVMVIAAADAQGRLDVVEALVTSTGFVVFTVVCARLTRRDWDAVQERFEVLTQRSTTDELTGLLNRRGLISRFPEVQRRALERGAPIGMVMLDIDFFSRINAGHGHAYGDAVLQRVCRLVLAQPGVEDGLVARIGGEELVVVVPRPVDLIAQQLRTAVATSSIHQGLTVSMGVMDADPASCTDAEALWRLVNLTDTAMYQAKESGRDRIVEVADGSAAGRAAQDADGWAVAPPAVATPMPGRPPVTLDPERADPEPPLDIRLFGVFTLSFAVIGLIARGSEKILDAQTYWTPVALILLGLVALHGLLAVVMGVRLPRFVANAGYLMFEATVIATMLATTGLSYRLLIACLLAVPVLCVAHAGSVGWLGFHYAIEVVGIGIAANAGSGLDVEWFHRTLSLSVVLGAAPGVLFWLRRRRAAANQQLQLLTAIDPLTGVHNRGGLERGIIHESTTRRIAVLAVNIDGFKALNDTFGHVYGDQALIQLAGSLAATAADDRFRISDPGAGSRQPGRPRPLTRPVVARTGGDRFVVVVAHPMDPQLAQRVGRAVAALPITLSVSSASAAGTVTDVSELWQLVAAADAALDQSKLDR